MDRDQFDAIVKQAATGGSRRGALRLLVGSALAPALAQIGVEGGDAAQNPAPADCQNLGRKCEQGGRRCCGNSICKNGRCRCESNKKRCKGRCIRQNKCCKDRDCGNCSRCGDNGRCTSTCGPCQRCDANGRCVSTCGACQNCNASGVCASTCGLGQTCQSNRCVCQQAERFGNTELTANGVRIISDPGATDAFGGLRFAIPGASVAFGDITRLQSAFNAENPPACREGSPRFSLITASGNIFVYFDADNNCPSGNADTGNLIDPNSTNPRFDLSQLGGNVRSTYAEAAAFFAQPNRPRITRIVLVADAGSAANPQRIVVSPCVQVAGGSN